MGDLDVAFQPSTHELEQLVVGQAELPLARVAQADDLGVEVGMVLEVVLGRHVGIEVVDVRGRTVAFGPTVVPGEAAGIAVDPVARVERTWPVDAVNLAIGERRLAAFLAVRDRQGREARHVVFVGRPPADADVVFEKTVDRVESAARSAAVEQQVLALRADDPGLGTEAAHAGIRLADEPCGSDLDGGPGPRRTVVRHDLERGRRGALQIVGQLPRRGLFRGYRVIGQTDDRECAAVVCQLEGRRRGGRRRPDRCDEHQDRHCFAQFEHGRAGYHGAKPARHR